MSWSREVRTLRLYAPWGHKCSTRCDNQWPSAGRKPEHSGSVLAEGSGGVRPASFWSVIPDRQTTRVCSRSRHHQDSVAKKARPSKPHQNPMTTSPKSIRIYHNLHYVQTIRIHQNPLKSIRTHQNPIKTDQNPLISTRICFACDGDWSKSIRIH